MAGRPDRACRYDDPHVHGDASHCRRARNFRTGSRTSASPTRRSLCSRSASICRRTSTTNPGTTSCGSAGEPTGRSWPRGRSRSCPETTNDPAGRSPPGRGFAATERSADDDHAGHAVVDLADVGVRPAAASVNRTNQLVRSELDGRPKPADTVRYPIRPESETVVFDLIVVTPLPPPNSISGGAPPGTCEVRWSLRRDMARFGRRVPAARSFAERDHVRADVLRERDGVRLVHVERSPHDRVVLLDLDVVRGRNSRTATRPSRVEVPACIVIVRVPFELVLTAVLLAAASAALPAVTSWLACAAEAAAACCGVVAGAPAATTVRLPTIVGWMRQWKM